ncbi:Helicase associated domain protein [Streptomyces sp. NPDC005525]|uniref:Helicase associated domain protein n=1 Tax=Streptomyces sp. NPDC005525 TaxID=3364720 RepID=UPI0036A67FDD
MPHAARNQRRTVVAEYRSGCRGCPCCTSTPWTSRQPRGNRELRSRRRARPGNLLARSRPLRCQAPRAPASTPTWSACLRLASGALRLFRISLREGPRPRARHQEGAYPLGRWLSDQRRSYRAGTMSSTRANELEGLGMIWDTADTAFAENLAAARVYCAQAATPPPSTNPSDNGSPTSADPADSAKTPNAPHGGPSNSPRSTPTGTPDSWGGPSTGNATGPACACSSREVPASRGSCPG